MANTGAGKRIFCHRERFHGVVLRFADSIDGCDSEHHPSKMLCITSAYIRVLSISIKEQTIEQAPIILVAFAL